jgi:glycosyltransferase involved in cell wall biosynthesis
LPRVNQSALAIIQKVADILLMPFPKKAHYEYFMTPLKMFEYMASKRPIIASDLPSIREILNEENCFFCQPGNTDNLAAVIKNVLNTPLLAEQKSYQAYQDVLPHTWQRRAQRIIKIITNLK